MGKNVNKEVKELVDQLVEEKEVKATFNTEEFAKAVVLAFSDHEAVEVIADTDLDKPRDTSCVEYEYIHFFKKGTQKDLFKMYNKGRQTRFAVSSKLDINSDTGYDVRPVMNNKTNTVKWINVFTGHEDAIEVAKILIEAYANIPVVEKKAAPKEEVKAKVKKTTKPKKQEVKEAQ